MNNTNQSSSPAPVHRLVGRIFVLCIGGNIRWDINAHSSRECIKRAKYYFFKRHFVDHMDNPSKAYFFKYSAPDLGMPWRDFVKWGRIQFCDELKIVELSFCPPNVRDDLAGANPHRQAENNPAAGSSPSTCWAGCTKCDNPTECHPDCPHRARK